MAKAGQAVNLIEMGQLSPQEMIHKAQFENQAMTWIFRLLSLIMLIGGFSLIMRPVVVLADFVPFFGSLVGFGTGAIAVIGGLALWTLAVTIAWFTVRPVWSVGLIALVTVICYLLYVRKKRKNLVKQ
jgi:hypothetical protein